MTHPLRIHVHPSPEHHDYDLHLPFYGVVYDKDIYTQKVRELAPTDDCAIILTSNGEPDQRLVLAANELRTFYKHVTISNPAPCYPDSDEFFRNSFYRVLPKIQKDYALISDFYLQNYTKLPEIIKGSPVSFQGFMEYKNYTWFHYGCNMPESQNEVYNSLNKFLEPIFEDFISSIESINLDKNLDVRSNLILRLNHGKPGKNFDDKFRVPKHLDTSILTAWIWSSECGACLYDSDREIAVENLHDQTKEYLIVPGLDYCDFSTSMKLATWHGVRSIGSDQHRLSIVGFLRRPVDQ